MRQIFFLVLFLWVSLPTSVPGQPVDWPEQVEIGSLLVLDGPEGVACAWGISGTDIDGDAYDPVWREFQGAVAVETRYGGLLTIELQTSAKRGLSEIKWCIAVGDVGSGEVDEDEDELVKFVVDLTLQIKTTPVERGEVAAIFNRLVKRIEEGDLRGSVAVINATKSIMFVDGTTRQNWQPWYASLSTHLLDKLQLVTQKQWAQAFVSVSQGVVK